MTNPVSFSQGGSGVATNTAYGLLIGGTTSTGPIQQLGTGTANQIIVSAGSAAPGAWTKNDAVGTWQLVATTAASSSATIAFTGLTTSYEIYKVIISNLIPQTTNTHLRLQFSANNGSSYQTGATAYFYCGSNMDQGATASWNNGNPSYIQLDHTGISTTANANTWEITFIETATSLTDNGCSWQGRYLDATGTFQIGVVGQGRYNGTQATNAIQFLMSSGNISSGTFKLYGLLV